MGMDSVELVLELEDQFRVELPDAECAEVRTVADLAAVVIRQLPRATAGCPTARRFRRLQDDVAAATGMNRRDLRPRTPIADVFPPDEQRRRWAEMRARDQRVPRLTTTGTVDAWLLVATVALIVAAIAVMVMAAAKLGAVPALLLGLLTIAAGTTVLRWVHAHWARKFPAGCHTLGDLARITMPPRIPTEPGARLSFEQDVLSRVRHIVAEQFGRSPEHVEPSHRLIEDLGMD